MAIGDYGQAYYLSGGPVDGCVQTIDEEAVAGRFMSDGEILCVTVSVENDGEISRRDYEYRKCGNRLLFVGPKRDDGGSKVLACNELK